MVPLWLQVDLKSSAWSLKSSRMRVSLSAVSDLVQSTCVPCRGGVPTLNDAEIAALATEVPEWRVVEVEGVRRIERTFSFANFREALAFTVAVGELAEREGHHPDLHLSWGKVRVETWTHKIRGLHRNDFVLAAKIDAIHEAGRGASRA
jgi:4a-hydroxytetrahydrobiopterin dehydratase